MIRIDLHTHSRYSKDSHSSIDDIIRAVPAAGLHGIALTDHDEFAGTMELKDRAPFVVIPGEEIKTSSGEIIGLFLSEWIPPGMTPTETIDAIRDQGGVVYVPHPFDGIRHGRISECGLDAIADKVDVLEVFNARCALPRFNKKAQLYASRRGILAGAGSDAHTCPEYGAAYIEMPRFDDANSFREGLRSGVWHGRLSSPLVHLRTRIDVLRKAASGGTLTKT